MYIHKNPLDMENPRTHDVPMAARLCGRRESAMKRTTLHEGAVVMNLLGGDEPDFAPVEFGKLVRSIGGKTAQGALRVIRVGDEKITTTLMVELLDVARHLVLGSSGKLLREQLEAELAAPHGGVGSMWFAYEPGRSVHRLDQAEVERTAHAWSTRTPAHPVLARRARADAPQQVLVVLEPDADGDIDALWSELEQSLRVSPQLELPAAADLLAPLAIPAPVTPAQAAIELRDELLARGWPTSAEVGAANGSRSVNKGQWAKTKRDEGELLGVWSASERTYRHPVFQFHADGSLRPRLKELLDALATHADFSAEADAGGWRRAFWLHGASYALAGADGQPRVPAEVFVTEPDRVIRAACKDAEAGPHESW